MSVVVIKVMMHFFIQQIFVEYWGYTSKKKNFFSCVELIFSEGNTKKSVDKKSIYYFFYEDECQGEICSRVRRIGRLGEVTHIGWLRRVSLQI